MGRRHKPAQLLLITGSKRGLRRREPEAPGFLTDPPDWLSGPQQALWRGAVEAAPAGLLRRLDGGVLVVWCVATDLLRQASEKLTEEGMIVTGKTGVPVRSPYVAIIGRQSAIVMASCAALGFSPVSRASISAGPGSDPNPFGRNGKPPSAA